MSTRRLCETVLLFALVVTAYQFTAFAQEPKDIATLSASRSTLKWNLRVTSNSSATITVTAPDGRVFRHALKAGATPEFRIVDAEGNKLPDGHYTYELRVTPQLSKRAQGEISAARGKDDEPEDVRAARKRSGPPDRSVTQSGDFLIHNGAFIVAGSAEETPAKRTGKIIQPGFTESTRAALIKLRQHHLSAMPVPDHVIPDDLIVIGSTCVGLDCVNNEDFGFDTIRMKENNTRLQFTDTSTSAGFPTNNWQIRANDSASGGANFLAFVDQGDNGNSESGTISFRVDGGAPANSLKVSSVGRVGIRTATPVLDLHITTSNTPSQRLEQTNTGGFSAQIWDIGGNEANFFIRDVTSGSRLPLRIRPGAPTSSLDISANGNVGIGTASPAVKLHSVVSSNNTSTAPVLATDIGLAISNSDTTANNLSVISLANSASAGQAQIGSVNLGSAPNSGGHLFFTTRGAGGALAERMRLTSAGRLGIGTNTPDQVLTVNGDASKVGGGSWLVFSDERLKNVKGDFNSGLTAVLRLQPLRYEYRENNVLGLKPHEEHIGFGAQALQKIIPEAVTTNGEGHLMVNNDPILWTMLNAIKEQQQQIEQLKREVRELRARSGKQP